MWEDIPTFKHDLQVRTLAVVSARSKTDPAIANKAWDAMRSDSFSGEMREIKDPGTYKIGMKYQPWKSGLHADGLA